MRKLLKKLVNYQLNHDNTDLTRWQRDIIYNFVIDYIKGVKKQNGRK